MATKFAQDEQSGTIGRHRQSFECLQNNVARWMDYSPYASVLKQAKGVPPAIPVNRRKYIVATPVSNAPIPISTEPLQGGRQTHV